MDAEDTNTGVARCGLGLWGWVETVLKLVGIGAGFAAFFGTGSGTFTLGGNPELAATIVLALLTLFALVALFLRIRQQEVISLVYAVLNTLGHVALLVALLRSPGFDFGWLPVIFGAAFVLGELAKQVFLTTTGYTEAGQSSGSMLNFSRGLAAVYLVFMILILL